MPQGRPKGFDEQVVLEVAMETFWREGYAGASMSILLKDMGISRQSLYDTYGDKRALYLKTLDLYITREVGNVLNLLSGSSSARDSLLEIITHFSDMAQSSEWRGCFIANALVTLKEDDHELARILNGALDTLFHGIQRSIQTALDLGEISSHLSATVLARGLLNSLMGLAATSKGTPTPAALADTVAAITDFLAPDPRLLTPVF
jgi:TetR/AcrR family transcriptional repressor of nem operon